MTFEETEKNLVDAIGIDITLDTVQLNGYDIRYVKAGSGSSLLLIHGANIGWGGWYKNIADLSKEYTVYALDLPGSGGSSKVNFKHVNFEKAFVETTRRFIERFDLHDLTILGHSLGGWIALRLALEDHSRIRRLILVDSVGFGDYIPGRFKLAAYYPFAKLLSKSAIPATTKGLKEFITSVMHEKQEADQIFIDYYHASVNRDFITHPLILINRLFDWISFKKEFILRSRLHEIDLPTLIIAGDRDPLIPLSTVQSYFSKISSAKIRIMKDAGHTPFLECPEEFNELILSWDQ